MAVVIVMGDVTKPTTADAALAYCKSLGNGMTDAECAQWVADQTINGEFCAGEVVFYLDANGQKAKRCVPDAVVQQKIAAMLASLGTKYDPLPASSAPVPPWVWVGAGVAVLALAYAVLR